MSRKLRFLDFFAGIGGFHKGMEQAGHECVGFCEFDKYATASYTSMWLLTDEQRERLSALDLKKRQKEILKDEYRNGMWYSNDIRKVTGENVPKADAYCFGAPCFVAGTLITTDTGFKHIEDVRAGDMVLTHMNRYKKVLRTMKHKGQGIYSIRTRSSQLTQATGNHRFFVLSGRNDFPEWKAIQEFDGSEWIQLPQRPEKRIVCKPGQSWTNGDIWEPIDYMSCDLEREETVYNMEVEDDNSYTANYLGVHNCQSFSVAGKRAGLDGQSGLIKEVFRILGEQEERDRPEWLIYENVAGMLSSSRGFDFLAILCEMEGLGYDIEWNTFNSKDWGVPQNRVRIYTIGHLRAKGAAKVFPLEGPGGEDSLEVRQIGQLYGTEKEPNPSGGRVYDADGIMRTIGTGHGMSEPFIGLNVLGSIKGNHGDFYEKDRGRVFDSEGIAPCLRASDYKEAAKITVPLKSFAIDKSIGGEEREVANALTAREDRGVSNHAQVVIPVLTPDREEKRQNGRRFKDDGEPMFTLTAQDKHGVAIGIDPELLGGVGEPFLDGKWPRGNRIYDGDKCAVTVTAQPVGRAGGYNPLYAVPIGGCYSGQSEDYSRGIYEGATRTLKAEKGDGCVALGILWDDRSDYDKEIRKDCEAGNSNTIDTVANDNPLAVGIRNDVEISDDEKVTIQIKEAVKKGYSEAKEGDSINFQFPNSTLRRGRIGHEVANTLDTSCNQAVMVTKKSECADVKDKQGLFVELYEGCVVYAIWYEKYQCYVAIRKLTPRECFRLQAFSDEDFDRAEFVNSDTQLYKQAGNSITTTIARAIGEKLAEIECEGESQA